MFLLLPARSRLVFNENRDCWYLRRTPRSLLPYLANVVGVLRMGIMDPTGLVADLVLAVLQVGIDDPVSAHRG